MNDLILELFQAISARPELDEEGRQRVFGWLAALLSIPYLDHVEKQNALILLDFLEGMAGGEVFAPLYQAARTKLRFETPETWTMAWPDNYQVSVNGENLTLEDLRRRGIAYVDFHMNKPIRSSVEYAVIRRLHADGTVEIIPDYQVFGDLPTGERHMFHAYGEKAVGNSGQR